jgi:hypothetical protein
MSLFIGQTLAFYLSAAPVDALAVKLIGRSRILPSDGAYYMTLVDKQTLLMHSRCRVYLWHFSGTTELKQLDILKLDWCFRSFDYCPSTRTLAFSNSNSINSKVVVRPWRWTSTIMNTGPSQETFHATRSTTFLCTPVQGPSGS